MAHRARDLTRSISQPSQTKYIQKDTYSLSFSCEEPIQDYVFFVTRPEVSIDAISIPGFMIGFMTAIHNRIPEWIYDSILDSIYDSIHDSLWDFELRTLD